MFAIVLLTLVLLSESRADFPHSWNCASGSGKNVSIQSTDIPGSYIVTYCAPAADEETKWDLRVGTLSNISPSNCIFSSKTESRITTRHSSVLIPVQNGNCSRVSDTFGIVIPIIFVCVILSIRLDASCRSASLLNCTYCTEVVTAWRTSGKWGSPTMPIIMWTTLILLALNIFAMDLYFFIIWGLSE